jgi:hypothetical protein
MLCNLYNKNDFNEFSEEMVKAEIAEAHKPPSEAFRDWKKNS